MPPTGHHSTSLDQAPSSDKKTPSDISQAPPGFSQTLPSISQNPASSIQIPPNISETDIPINLTPPTITPRQKVPARKPPRHPVKAEQELPRKAGVADQEIGQSQDKWDTKETGENKDFQSESQSELEKATQEDKNHTVTIHEDKNHNEDKIVAVDIQETKNDDATTQEDKNVIVEQKDDKLTSEKHTLVIADSGDCVKNYDKNLGGKVSIVSIDWDSEKPSAITDHTPSANNNNDEGVKEGVVREETENDEMEKLKMKKISQSDTVEKDLIKKKIGKPGEKVIKPSGYVGFDSLPDQVYRKAVRKGFEFTLMVVGESGLGKSTLVNSMFLTDIYSSKFPGEIPKAPKTLKVETHKVLLEEKKVKLSLTVVDTPGFGDAVDNSDCWKPIINFVDEQFRKFLEAETRVNRVELPDTRVHVCLYFIAPSGHGLKPLDIEFMSRLHDKVNIIPVIGKADTFTTEELRDFKQRILSQIKESKIHIYDFPLSDSKKESQDFLSKRAPFGVVGSNTVIEEKDGDRRRGRKYPWGTVIIENEDHCDFIPLRNLLLAYHMQDLKDVTNNTHYENYRCDKLSQVMRRESNSGKTIVLNKNPLAALEDDHKNHGIKLEKMKEEMEEVFGRKLGEKEQKMKETEREMEEKIEQSRDRLDKQRKDLDREKEQFYSEKKIWETSNCISVEELKRQSNESLDTGKKKKYGFGNLTKQLTK